MQSLRNVSKRRLRKINTLTKRITRLSKKNTDLYAILLQQLRQENVETKYINMLDSINKNDIIKRFLQKQCGDVLSREYSLEIKKFAVTLHYLSPKAYSFVREQFENVLPHPKSISAWYKGLDCRPGFTTEALNTLQLRAQENPNKTIFCALAMDEMAIRKQVEWDGKEYFGYSNVGCYLDSDDVPLAKEALTFMVTSINDTFKVPVGYFLIHSITAQQKAALVEQCLTLLNNCGVKVVSLTFDGAATNKAMCTHLGCDMKSESSFMYDGQEVCLWPDPCHNIKLVRNTFGDKKTFIDFQGNTVTWFYIELLNQIQNEEGLHLGTKLKDEHVNYIKQKMKVRLATQLLSESVADAMEFCKQLGIPEFAGCDGTVMFIRLFNNLFDIMNSRNMRAKGWKRALTSFNIQETIEFFAAAEIYIKGLKLGDGQTFVINSNRSTGFCGFLTCMSSLIKLFNAHVVPDNTLKYICTYKLSQDHLELFFGAIRSKCGFNNNPSARVFCAAYKKLLVHAQFKDSATGNCIPLDKITVLNCTSDYKRAIDDSTDCRRRFEPEVHDTFEDNSDTEHDYIFNPSSLTEYSKNVVEYIAGFIGRKLKKTLKCEKCIEIIEDTEHISGKSLIDIKNRGGLFKPTSDLNRICQVSEKILREYQARIGSKYLGQQRNLLQMINKVSAKVLPTQVFCKLKDHSLEQSLYDDHRNLLIKSIAQKYFKIRIHYITKKLSIPTEKIRTYLTKTIIFKGQ